MTVSIELVTMIVTVASTLLGLAAGFGWMITRTDARFESFEQWMDARFERAEQRTNALLESFEQRMDARFERAERRMDARFEKSEQRADARFDRLETDIGEVKIAIARLEGPTPHLLVTR
ncbi:response regulator [Microbacterium foliorum]|uniref:response regulator n=1 Tax=Microbacterium foliorum TaxID=104336 RepID=UPI0028D82E8A|nr:response regulator [Microbacterium foliorum]